MAALALILMLLLPAKLRGQDRLFPIVMHPAIFKALSYAWLVADHYELAVCIHGTVEREGNEIQRMIITHLTLPWVEPDSVSPRQVRGIRCVLKDLLGLAHTHRSEQVPLPDRCMLSALDAAANEGRLQIVVCAEDVMSIWWPVGTGVLCRFDPRAPEPVCRPWGNGTQR